MSSKGYCFDIEADNLYLTSKVIWYIKFKSLDGSRSLSVYPFRFSKEEVVARITEWNNSFEDGCLVVGHNILGYDIWMLWRHLGITPKVGKNGKDWFGDKHVQYFDTYVCSQFLNPDSPLHSLGYLASGSEDEKMDYRQKLIDAKLMTGAEPKGHEFSFWNEIMPKYCDDDVDANIGVFKKLWNKASEMYEGKWLHSSFRQVQKDYWLYSAQAYTGVQFHRERALDLTKLIEGEMEVIKKEIDPQLPPRPLKTAEKAFYKIPSKPFTKSGEMSATFLKWLEKHNATYNEGIITAYGLNQKLIANEVLDVQLPMEIDDNQELKQWFIDNGWVASEGFWNFKKDPITKKNMRDERGKLIPTTPKIQSQGVICPNLLKLEGEIPKKVVKYLSYRNRLGVVTGWLNNWRIEFDGRLSAEINGYAPTSRLKHKTVVNCPKADIKVLLGAEMRDLFIVPEGYKFIGTDFSALENRTLSHYTYKYDDGAFARMQTEGDPHSFNAFAFFPHISEKFDINNPENKENSDFKPWRNKAKTGAYLLAFGGGAPKLASSLGLSAREGKEAYDNYWNMNVGLGKLKEAAEKYFDTTGKKKYIKGIDGRVVSVRGKNVLLSCLGQGLGAICMSYAACLMDTWLGELYLDLLGRPHYIYKGKYVSRIMVMHDEYSWQVDETIAEDIREMTIRAAVKAGEILKLALPLAAEGKIGDSWKDVH